MPKLFDFTIETFSKQVNANLNTFLYYEFENCKVCQ